MRTRGDQGTALPSGHGPRPDRPMMGESPGLAELLIGGLSRDLRNFLPGVVVEPARIERPGAVEDRTSVRWVEPKAVDEPPELMILGRRFRVVAPAGQRLTDEDRRMGAAILAVTGLRHHFLFRGTDASRADLFQGGSEDHYVAAFLEPSAYAAVHGTGPSRVAPAILTLRTAALSTYENHRVSTGALLLGPGESPRRPTPVDALPYGVGLTALKSLSRLCDGEHTVFLVDRDGKLGDIVAIDDWAVPSAGVADTEVPCSDAYTPHARATLSTGRICLVLSRHQEIKIFAEGTQAFAFANGRWRLLECARKYEVWRSAVPAMAPAKSLFRAALNLANARRGALFVVVDDPEVAVGRLVALHDRLASEPTIGPTPDPSSTDPLARRTLHYLARDRSVSDLAPSVLEALASIDGALVVDRAGRIISFGAILRHDATGLPALAFAEGARTTAALAASTFGAVLKVSEDGVVSCFIDGRRAWDL